MPTVSLHLGGIVNDYLQIYPRSDFVDSRCVFSSAKPDSSGGLVVGNEVLKNLGLCGVQAVGDGDHRVAQVGV